MITSNVKCVMKLEKITEDCILHRMNSAQKVYSFHRKISISQINIACLKFQGCLYICIIYKQWCPMGMYINKKYFYYF